MRNGSSSSRQIAERRRPCRGRFVPPVERRQLVRQGVEQSGDRAPIGVVGVAQRPFVLGDRLAVGAEGGGSLGRTWRPAAHPGDVAGGLGVERQAGVVVAAERLQRIEHLAMDVDPPVRGDRRVDGDAGQLVAEPDRIPVDDEQAGGDELVDVLTVEPGLDQQRRLGPLAEHGDDLQRRPGLRAELHGAGHDRVARRARQLGGAGAQQLGDEVGVAAGEAMQLGGIEPGTIGQLGHRRRRQRPQIEVLRRRLPSQLADHLAQTVVGGRLVAVGRHDEARQRAHPPGEEAQQVERGVVGPVDVLDDQHGELAEHVEQCGEQLGPLRAGAPQHVQPTADVGGQIDQGAERTGRELPVARQQVHAGVGDERHQRFDQRRLADAGLAGDQHDAARPGPCRGDPVAQRGQLGGTLDQPHPASLPASVPQRLAHSGCA